MSSLPWRSTRRRRSPKAKARKTMPSPADEEQLALLEEFERDGTPRPQSALLRHISEWLNVVRSTLCQRPFAGYSLACTSHASSCHPHDRHDAHGSNVYAEEVRRHERERREHNC